MDTRAKLEGLKGKDLKAEFKRATGEEAHSNNRTWMINKILLAGEPKGEAPAPKATKKVKEPKAPKAKKEKAPRERDPRLPKVGTVLEREFQGKKIHAEVLEQGFKYHGKEYRSLSAIAKEVTGTIWNGMLFFHLIPYAKREKKAA